MTTDTHLHLFDLLPHQPDCLEFILRTQSRVITSCHTKIEADALSHWIHERPELAGLIGMSFGIHPQLPVHDELDNLIALVQASHNPHQQPRLRAIGECGYDFWNGRSDSGTHSVSAQDELFIIQTELAIQSGLPLIIHIRRGIDMIFHHARLLSRVKSVIFHSWPSPPEEARSLLAKGINAWFSLGTPLLQGNKKCLRSLVELPIERILLETDAPYQTLKDRTFTGMHDLASIQTRAAEIRGMSSNELITQISQNFAQALDWPINEQATDSNSK